MTEQEIEQLTPSMREYAKQMVTLGEVTKPLHEWVTERGLTLAKVKDRRSRNSWAESLEPGNLKSKKLRQAWGMNNNKPKKGTKG